MALWLFALISSSEYLQYTSVSVPFGLDSYHKLPDQLVRGSPKWTQLGLDFCPLSLLTDSITQPSSSWFVISLSGWCFPFAIWSEFSLLCHHSSVDRQAPGNIAAEVHPWKNLCFSKPDRHFTAIYSFSRTDFSNTCLHTRVHSVLSTSKEFEESKLETVCWGFTCVKISSYHCAVCCNGLLRVLATQIWRKYWWPAKSSTFWMSQEKLGFLSTNFTIFHPHTVYFSQCIPVIPSWINYVWVKSLFFVISFEISTPLHQTAWKAGDYNDWIFHFSGKPDLLLGTLNNTESTEYKLARRT